MRGNWLLGGFVRYAAFGGRSRRLEYWGFSFVLFGLGLWAVLVDLVLGTRGGGADGVGACLTMLVLLSIIPGIAVAIRRLHDAGFSGWWVLAGFIPLLGPILALCLGLLPPDSGSRFGTDPREPFYGAFGWVFSAVLLLYGLPLSLLLEALPTA